MPDHTLERIKTALGREPWDRDLRRVYADCLEEAGQDDAAETQRRAAGKMQKRRPKGRPPARHASCGTTDNPTVYQRLRAEQVTYQRYGCPRVGPDVGRRPGHTSWKKYRKQRWRAK